MDLFVFNNNKSTPTKMTNGKLIGNVLSATWIERYREASEFEVTAYASTGIKQKMPLGGFVSHLNTNHLMIIENHEIVDEKDEVPIVKVSGRGFETYLTNRIVGSNIPYPSTAPAKPYAIPAWPSITQATSLIQRHISLGLVESEDVLPYVNVVQEGEGPTKEARSIKYGDLWTRTLELLAVDDLGIRVERPGQYNPGPTNYDSTIVVHSGVDYRNQLMLTFESGDLETAEYLWSNQKVKNFCMVTGKWVQTRVGNTTKEGYDRRWMYLDATDVDQDQAAYPASGPRALIVSAMQARGREALAKQKGLVLVKADASKTMKGLQYRHDYNIGDIVTVGGSYIDTAPMRVTEYVEILDENGFNSHPTLTPLPVKEPT